MSSECSSLKRLSVVDLQEMGDELKDLIERDQVYCMQNVLGELRYGRLSLTEEKLCIHHMEDSILPHDSYVVNYQDVMTLVDPSSRLTFLELGARGGTLGRLIIRLTPDTKGAQQFAELCSGEKGVSYADTKLFHVHHRGKKWEYIGGGDYECNNGDGGKALVAGLELGPEYERPWVAGTVRGFWGLGTGVSAQFFISTRDFPSAVCSPAFGMVEEGLRVLKNAIIDHPDIREVYVQDCGIILNI